MSSEKVNLLNYDHAGMQQLFLTIDESRFRATQLIKWIHQSGLTNFDEMTNLSKSLRSKLHDVADIKLPEIAYEKISQDGTFKWLLRLSDGNCIETVYIPEHDRGTLCVSSQVGCALNCSFCSTGKEGFNRNLSIAEIIGQVWLAVRRVKVTNVVMMGMGEPLLNYDNVIAAMNLMLDDQSYGLSKHRVTLSTSGVVPKILELKSDSPVSLAVSLHAPTNDIRSELVPLNKKYPLEELIPVCKHYFANEPRRSVMFEYVMLDGVNDSLTQAKQLIRLLDNMPCKVNLIPFNPFPKANYKTSSEAAITAFQERLMGAGINTRVRRTRGDDIDGACGQLAGEIKDRTGRHERWQRMGRLVPVAKESREH